MTDGHDGSQRSNQGAASVAASPDQQLARRLIEASTDGILAFDVEYRFTVWNRAMEGISGIPAERVLGRVAFEVFPFLVETGEDRCFRDALAGRSTVSTDRPYDVPESGRHGFFEGYYAPLEGDDGRVVGGLAIVREVTERRRAEAERLALARTDAARAEAEAAAQRFAFLARAGEVLSASLDEDDTLAKIAELAVPTLGDLCVVDVVREEGLLRVATAHVDPAKRALVEELRRRYPLTRDNQQLPARVLREGRPAILPTLSRETVAENTVDAEHAKLIDRLGARSYLSVPLTARGTTVGVIGLAITESDRRYDERDLAFAMDLARRAALAVDNARLYRTARDELAERRRIEAALRLSEGRFRGVMEQSPLSTQIFSADGRAVQVNRAWEELWGVKLDDISDWNVLDDAQLVKTGVHAYLERAFAGEAVEIPANRYNPDETLPDRTKNAEPVRWVRAFAYPVKDAAGQVIEVVLLQEDVTARVLAEAALRRSEERLRVALHGAHMNVWAWNLATDVVECSDNAREFWGIDIGSAADFVTLIHPDDQERVWEIARRVMVDGGGYQSEYRLITPDGRLRWVQSRGIARAGANGKVAQMIGVTVDITERRLAEEATRLLADAGETLGRSLDVATTLGNLTRVVVPRLADFCGIDLLVDGELERVASFHLDANKAARWSEMHRRYPPRRTDRHGAWHAISTLTPEWGSEISDEVLAAVAHDDEHRRMLRELGIRSYLFVPLTARGETLGVLALAHTDDSRRFSAADVALATDLARRAASAVDNARLYERLRVEDQRKDEFLATLAHELRNPLAPIQTGLEVLRLAPPDRAERARSVMERQLGHMVRLIDDLLDLSRVTRGKIELQPESLDVGALVANALEVSRPLVEAAGLELSVRLPGRPLCFRGDKTRLSQVLSNLVNNAAKFTPRGGKVEIEVERDGGEVVLRVRDTGIGIPAEMLSQVFELFAQVERGRGGLGIGLTLVRRLVELHGGRVWAESDGSGRGTTFVIRLPGVVDSEPLAGLEHREVQPRASRRVLVVDDNLDAAEMLETMLTLDGHEVRRAASAPEALEIVREFHPDVAFLDIGLPGMSGYELARRLRAERALASATLVALTGWGQEQDRRQSREAGFDHHLTKPVEPRDIYALLI